MISEQNLLKSWQEQARFRSIHRRMTFCKTGLELGSGTIIAAAASDQWGRPTLVIDGQEERILALLSIAHDHPIAPSVLQNLRDAARWWGKNNLTQAYIHLAFSGLQPLPHGEEAPRRLFIADQLLRKGVDAAELLLSTGLLPQQASLGEWRKLAKQNDNHIAAGSPEGGQFAVKGYVTSLEPKQITDKAKDNGGWLQPPDATAKNAKQCVSLVRAVIPGMPHAGDWKEGAKITGYGTPPIKPGTAIATFTDGAYKNQITDNHAAIFLGYMTKGGLKGISVIDQYDNKDHHGPADIRFIPMTKQPHPKYWATKFSVIAVGLSSHKK